MPLDRLHYSLAVLEDPFVLEPQHFYPEMFQKQFPLAVLLDREFVEMDLYVKLDREAFRGAVEI